MSIGVGREMPARALTEIELGWSIWQGAILQDMPNPKPSEHSPLGPGHFVLLGALAAILILTLFWAITTWTSTDDVPISKHGWIALGLGTFFSLLIGCGLMALMFYSSRSGHDDVATPKLTERGEETTNDQK